MELNKDSQYCPHCSDENNKHLIKNFEHVGFRMCTNPKCPVGIITDDDPVLETSSEDFPFAFRNFDSASESGSKALNIVLENHTEVVLNKNDTKTSANDGNEVHKKDLLQEESSMEVEDNVKLVCPNCSTEKITHFIEKNFGLLVCSNLECSMVIPDDEDPKIFLATIAQEKNMLQGPKKCDTEFKPKPTDSRTDQKVMPLDNTASSIFSKYALQTKECISDELKIPEKEFISNELRTPEKKFISNELKTPEKECTSIEIDTKCLYEDDTIELPELCFEDSVHSKDVDCDASFKHMFHDNLDYIDFLSDCVQQNNISDSGSAPVKYIMFDNDLNLCWLNSSLHLLAHNRTAKKFITESCMIKDVIRVYHEVIEILNQIKVYQEDLINARNKLATVQNRTLNYLRPLIKFKTGIPDSSFCAILNLVNESKICRRLFEVKISWKFVCRNCFRTKVHVFRKTVITLSKVAFFDPVIPLTLCMCPTCKTPDQERELSYLSTSKCLIFHFESGAGTGILEPQDFSLGNQKYKMTGVILLKKLTSSLNHFLTWIRDPEDNTWLECDDLQRRVVFYSKEQPQIKLEEVHIIMYETKQEADHFKNSTGLKKSKDSFKSSNDTPQTSDLDEKAKTSYDIPSLDEDAFIDLTGVDENKKCSINNNLNFETDRKGTDDDSSSYGSVDASQNDESKIVKKTSSLKSEVCLRDTKVRRPRGRPKKVTFLDMKGDKTELDYNEESEILIDKKRKRTKKSSNCSSKKKLKVESEKIQDLSPGAFERYNENDILGLPVFKQVFGDTLKMKAQRGALKNKVSLHMQLRKFVKDNIQEKSSAITKEQVISDALMNVNEIVRRTIGGITQVLKNSLTV